MSNIDVLDKCHRQQEHVHVGSVSGNLQDRSPFLLMRPQDLQRPWKRSPGWTGSAGNGKLGLHPLEALNQGSAIITGILESSFMERGFRVGRVAGDKELGKKLFSHGDEII